MNYIFDTNILLFFLRDHPSILSFRNTYRPLSDGNNALISVVSVGEIKSIALRNNWGEKKLKQLYELMSLFVITDINAADVIDMYAEIDTYSQGKLKDSPITTSARNMGKNDLWIAATAAITKATLITSDNDFKHLDGIYLDMFNPISNN
jgi:predicted nucleic acid-binding protein